MAKTPGFDEPTYLRQQLAELQREYHARIAPIIEKLVKIESMRPPAPVIVCAECLMVQPNHAPNCKHNHIPY